MDTSLDNNGLIVHGLTFLSHQPFIPRHLLSAIYTQLLSLKTLKPFSISGAEGA
jgi:hypothetical protein